MLKPIKKPYERITSLGEEKVVQLDRLLNRGEKTSKVCTLIQEGWEDLLDMSRPALIKMLNRYRNTALRGDLIKELAANGLLTTVKGLKRLDALEEMTNMALIQKERVSKVYSKESKMPLLMKQVTEELTLMNKLLDSLSRLQLEIGVLKRAPKDYHGSLTQDADEPGMVRFRITEETLQAMEYLEGVDYERLN